MNFDIFYLRRGRDTSAHSQTISQRCGDFLPQNWIHNQGCGPSVQVERKSFPLFSSQMSVAEPADKFHRRLRGQLAYLFDDPVTGQFFTNTEPFDHISWIVEDRQIDDLRTPAILEFH